MEVKYLHEEIATLQAAIEEAINKGQKSMDGLNDLPGPVLISNKDFALPHMNAGSEVVGWVDDF
jgi:hypothetical protein